LVGKRRCVKRRASGGGPAAGKWSARGVGGGAERVGGGKASGGGGQPGEASQEAEGGGVKAVSGCPRERNIHHHLLLRQRQVHGRSAAGRVLYRALRNARSETTAIWLSQRFTFHVWDAVLVYS